MNNVSYLYQGDNLALFANGKSYMIEPSDINYGRIIDALSSEDWDEAGRLADIATDITETYSKDGVTIENGVVFVNGKELHNAMTERLVKLYKSGRPVTAIVNFLKRVMANPSRSSVRELYGFLESNKLPLTPEGKFLAYKRVKVVDGENWDVYSGTVRNNIGDEPEMPRNEVDDIRTNTCSEGLHFCSLEYLVSSGYGQNSSPTTKIIILEIDPADVVSIPTDYNNSKGRCCKYKVVMEHSTHAATDEMFDPEDDVVWGDDEEIEDDDWEDEVDEFEDELDDEIDESDENDGMGPGWIENVDEFIGVGNWRQKLIERLSRKENS